MFSNVRFIIWVSGFLLTSLLVLPVMMLTKRYNHALRHWWSRAFLNPFGIRLKVEGTPDPEARLLTPNHRSFLDIPILEAALPTHIDPAWIAKEQLMKTPVVKWMLRAGRMITVERENKRGMLKLLKDLQVPLGEGRSIVIFPEGTRSKTDRLLPFKSGARFIAEHCNLKVQPVVIYPSDQRLNTGKLQMNGGLLTVRFLPARLPEGDQWFAEMEAEMQQAYLDMARHSNN